MSLVRSARGTMVDFEALAHKARNPQPVSTPTRRAGSYVPPSVVPVDQTGFVPPPPEKTPAEAAMIVAKPKRHGHAAALAPNAEAEGKPVETGTEETG